MKIIKRFFANIRQRRFTARIEREIYHGIFPHLRGDVDHGYPFESRDALEGAHVRGCLNARINLRLIERMAAKMPKAYGEAFRYIAYRDLNERMETYLQLAEERVYQEDCDPRLVATHA